jgi:hypothetical protein
LFEETQRKQRSKVSPIGAKQAELAKVQVCFPVCGSTEVHACDHPTDQTQPRSHPRTAALTHSRGAHAPPPWCTGSCAQDQLDALLADGPALQSARDHAAAALDEHKKTFRNADPYPKDISKELKAAEEQLAQARERQQNERAKFGRDIFEVSKKVEEYTAARR